MAKNIGKIFEADFKKSTPDYALCYRLPDAAQSFGRNNNLRFSRKNPFDFLLWDSVSCRLYALELKTVSSTSISFARNESEQGKIQYHQIKGLNEWNQYNGITCGFVIEFRKIETTVFINIESFNTLIQNIEKKSFNMNDLANSGLPYIVISQKLNRNRYTYDVDQFLTDAKN